MKYPRQSPLELLNGSPNGVPSTGGQTSITPAKAKPPAINSSARNPGGPTQVPKSDDKEAPDVKKKAALAKGPVLTMNYDNAAAYGMPESLFTSLKDIFEAISASHSRMGVVIPTRFLELLRRDNEMFRTPMHQDAHEFLNIVLNEVVANVEVKERELEAERERHSSAGSSAGELVSKTAEGSRTPSNIRWVHELFEGTLTSETKCLTCENISKRDEIFLDLSVDLEQHSSVTSCLRKFSEEEMLCERNKFHCDRCGGLQEAEKRMKIKRLPKILALHLKRFKYTEDLQRLQKLFHRVVYPYHLRLFNTTDDAEDPDRLYELYAVVVHIGGGPYHGHYVSIIKTQDRGWLLFDDEWVEPVDKNFVRNFFGDRPGLACAYVLFYQETTIEAVKREQAAEPLAAVSQAIETPTTGFGLGLKTNGIFSPGKYLSKTPVSPTTEESDTGNGLNKVATAVHSSSESTILPIASTLNPTSNSKEEVQPEKRRTKAENEQKATEKVSEKTDRGKRMTLDFWKKDHGKKQPLDVKAADETNGVLQPSGENKSSPANLKNGSTTSNGLAAGLNRFRQTSKSLRRPKFWTSKESIKGEPAAYGEPGPTTTVSSPEKAETSKSRFPTLRRRKSEMLL